MSRLASAGVAAVWLLAVGAAATACTTTVDGAAQCPGCGIGTEPDFPRPTTPAVTPTMPTQLPPDGSGGLEPSDTGYVYIETKSGKTRCQISTESVGCESDFTDPPSVDGAPATGVEVSASGDHTWHGGNLGAIPTTPIDYATYHAVGWTIEADSSGTRFTNDGTGHGRFISTEGVQFF